MPKRPTAAPATPTPTPTCGMCGGVLILGMAHVCPNVAGNGNKWKWIAPLILAILTQFIGAIWWASSISADVAAIRNSQNEQLRRLERIEQQYFTVRPGGAP